MSASTRTATDGAVRRIPVDRTFAVPTARTSRHTPVRTRAWLSVWLCFEAFKIAFGL